MRNSITKINRKALILIFWLLIWESAAFLINNQILLPSPYKVLKSLSNLIMEQYFWKTILNSVIRVMFGLIFSIILGIILGLFGGINSFVEELFMPFITSIKATPVMSIIIIALVWFKADKVAIFTTILICFPIIYTNVLQGIKYVDINLLQMAEIYKVKRIYIIKDIYIPSIKNYLISGILMCLGLSWKVSVASEVLSTPKYSIGLNLLNTKATLETEELFAWTIVVIILSLIFELIFRFYINRKDKL